MIAEVKRFRDFDSTEIVIVLTSGTDQSDRTSILLDHYTKFSP